MAAGGAGDAGGGAMDSGTGSATGTGRIPASLARRAPAASRAMKPPLRVRHRRAQQARQTKVTISSPRGAPSGPVAKLANRAIPVLPEKAASGDAGGEAGVADGVGGVAASDLPVITARGPTAKTAVQSANTVRNPTARENLSNPSP